MSLEESNNLSYKVSCPKCKGFSKVSPNLRKRKANNLIVNSYKACSKCLGSGLVLQDFPPQIDAFNYPHVAIVGAGISGVALAVACLHRGIPFTIFERDENFNTRSQGYGLTLQQASKAVKAFGIETLKGGIVSTKHIVHSSNGEVLGEWGLRKWLDSREKSNSKQTNIHIARQALRSALIEELPSMDAIKWNHQLVKVHNQANNVALDFLVDGKLKRVKADIVVGCDGIRSTVRTNIFKLEQQPLRYLDCIVILGICPLSVVGFESDLLDGQTVFQTANGKERMYLMPFDEETLMWQFSFLETEEKAKALSRKGEEALKEATLKRVLNWHSPIPEIVRNTPVISISGYPVYDREILDVTMLSSCGGVTIIGDAAHPMSPFKGQGANQALLDAIELARQISKYPDSNSNWRSLGLREVVLSDFEKNMMKRASKKVEQSAKVAKTLHTDLVLKKCDSPRGNFS